MATRTRRDLVDQALRDLGVLPANATPSAADVSTVDDKVDGVLARLSALQIVTVANPDAIDDLIFNPVAIFLADAAKSEFGGAQVDVAGAETILRRVTRTGSDYAVEQGEFM